MRIPLGQENGPSLLLRFANRHGIIAGATGTGKTITLQTLVEGFSSNGVPVFLADVKGDLSGLANAGVPNERLMKREQELALGERQRTGFPVVFWDVSGERGHSIRTTVSEMGPLLLGRLLDLNETQEGVLNIAFKVADDEGLLLLDLKDLRSMLGFISSEASKLRERYGNVSSTSVGAIQRQLLEFEQQGGEAFFGEPALELADLIQTEAGRGVVNILVADKLVQQPRLYSTLLLWLLSELFEDLPEAGDLDKPKLVFVFDEAHLLFDDAPDALRDKVEQVVRLVRSKGVGIYFVTQSPLDIPESVLGQLGNRVQHALRAFTPKDQKAVKTAAQTFRANPALDTATAITELGIGEALVSFLDEDGAPSMVERVKVRPPVSLVGPASEHERLEIIRTSRMRGKYEATVDRDSAYEMLVRRASAESQAESLAKAQAELERERARQMPSRQPAGPRAPRPQPTILDGMMKAAGSQLARTVGRELVRGVLGSFMRRR